jgi:cell division protein FtsB
MIKASNPRVSRLLMAFAFAILLANALAGDRGLTATLRARKDRVVLAEQIQTLRAENARLRARALALKDDPATIEGVARRNLGLLRRDEIVVVVR